MDDDKGCLGGFVVLAIVIGGLYWAGGINGVWYAVEFGVSPSKIHMDPKPKDCDFMHAPLGEKECHYEAVVAANNAAGQQVGGDGAPKFNLDAKNGKPIISWDDGKTWDFMTTPDIPNRTVEAVIVTWNKKSD